MTPTRRAIELQPNITLALNALRGSLTVVPFNPVSIERTFKIAALDHAIVIIGPGLIRSITEHAPGVRLSFVTMGRTESLSSSRPTEPPARPINSGAPNSCMWRLSPADVAVVSVTEFITDGTRNALTGEAHIRGDARSFRPDVSARIEEEMHRIAEGNAIQYAIKAEVIYTREFVPLLNDAELTQHALEAVLGVSKHVVFDCEPMTSSEDFARFLDHAPGCFLLIGNGETSAPQPNL